MKYILIIFTLITTILQTFSQEIKVDAKLDTNVITIGDQFHLTLTLQKPENANIFFPNLQDTIIKQIEIVDTKEVDTISKNQNSILLQKQYTLTSFDSGAYIIEPIAFLIDSIDTIYTPKTLFVKVLTVPVDTTKKAIADIKAPFEAPMTFKEFIQEYWPYIALALFVILVAFIIYLYRDKIWNKKTEKPKVVKPKEPGYIVALRELEKLREKKLWQSNRVKEYYIELTDIIRRYLYNQFDIDSLEMTSSETLNEVAKLDVVDDETLSKLRQMFTTADFVKFAKAKPLPDENDLSYKNAYAFVEKTRDLLLKKKEEQNIKNELKNNTEISRNSKTETKN